MESNYGHCAAVRACATVALRAAEAPMTLDDRLFHVLHPGEAAAATGLALSVH
jgi:hypothetical protein